MGDITSNLLLHLEMDEGSGTQLADQGSGFSPGSMLGTTTWNNDATRGQSASFDGSTSAIISRLPAFSTNGFTVAAWVKRSATAGNNWDVIAGAAWNGDTGAWNSPYALFQLTTNSNTKKPFFKCSYSSTKQADVTGTTALADDTWTHLVGVFTNSSGSMTCDLYVNGSHDATGTTVTSGGGMANTNTATPGDLIIGTRGDVLARSSTEKWKGLIQGFRIYTRALASGDVTDLYNFTRGSVGTAPGLIHKYLLTEGSGTTATDSQGHQNGTISNGSWVTDVDVGNALQFNGTSTVVEVATNSWLEALVSNFSVSFWVKVDSTVDFTGYMTALCRPKSTSTWTPPAADFFMRVAQGGGSLSDLYGEHSSIESSTYRSASSQVKVSQTQWMHVCMTHDPTAGRVVYLNGQSNATNAKVGTYPVVTRTGKSLFIGNTGSSAASEFFKGKLRDVRVYANTLSSSDVSTLYSASAISYPNAHRYWRLSGINGAVGQSTYTIALREISGGPNMATGGTYTASSSSSGHGPELAFDDSDITYFALDSTGDKWIKVDLGAGNARNFVECRLYDSSNWHEYFSLDYSDDNSAWTAASSYTNIASATSSLVFPVPTPPKSLWAVNITATSASHVELAEMELRLSIGGADIATGYFPVGTAGEIGHELALSFDDNTGTYYARTSGPPARIGYWFPATQNVVQIALTAVAGTDYKPKDFDIQYSSDGGATWVTTSSYSGITWGSSIETKTFNAITNTLTVGSSAVAATGATAAVTVAKGLTLATSVEHPTQGALALTQKHNITVASSVEHTSQGALAVFQYRNLSLASSVEHPAQGALAVTQRQMLALASSVEHATQGSLAVAQTHVLHLEPSAVATTLPFIAIRPVTRDLILDTSRSATIQSALAVTLKKTLQLAASVTITSAPGIRVSQQQFLVMAGSTVAVSLPDFALLWVILEPAGSFVHTSSLQTQQYPITFHDLPPTAGFDRTIDYQAILNSIDPTLETDPWVVYVFGGGRVLKRERPSDEYAWAKPENRKVMLELLR